MAVASMVLGIISIIFSLYCGCISIVAAPIGLILGIVALVNRKPQQDELTGEVIKDGKGMAIAGVALCSIAIIILIINIGSIMNSGIVDEFMKEYNRQLNN